MPCYLHLILVALLLGSCTSGPPPSSSGRGLAAPVSVSYRCTGTEPFWSVAISPAGIVFQSPEVAPVTYPFVASKKSGQTIEFLTSLNFGSEKSTLKVILTPGNCSDGMSDTIYPFIAVVIRDGQQLRGCAKEML